MNILLIGTEEANTKITSQLIKEAIEGVEIYCADNVSTALRLWNAAPGRKFSRVLITSELPKTGMGIDDLFSDDLVARTGAEAKTCLRFDELAMACRMWTTGDGDPIELMYDHGHDAWLTTHRAELVPLKWPELIGLWAVDPELVRETWGKAVRESDESIDGRSIDGRLITQEVFLNIPDAIKKFQEGNRRDGRDDITRDVPK
ncbi:hypothetical protein AUK40_05300 [Candidatus Wirthbacteria bacterium CG2_30_54_11]|uniref:Uncharacterized protein n=1 Tax=Candidatus Wirthbacteria bacterium CG2_30_54_11 TaxID=1817892 RepID=A0A1J5IGF6_9BACT|nr:MAG: hypothetical protein AUK40_05300 [Candidatus Wirthbacteria bacterium CG2_30_54_11]